MIKEIDGNLLQLAIVGKFDVIAHGANCFCTMGSGIALQIKQVFPEAYRADLKTLRGDVYKLGEFSKVFIKERKLTIFNLYTQYETGAKFEYTAFALSLRNMLQVLKGDEKIGLPMIGAGLGGGNWEQIKKIIVTELSDYDVTIVKYIDK